jgi:hypothetical protein
MDTPTDQMVEVRWTRGRAISVPLRQGTRGQPRPLPACVSWAGAGQRDEDRQFLS